MTSLLLTTFILLDYVSGLLGNISKAKRSKSQRRYDVTHTHTPPHALCRTVLDTMNRLQVTFPQLDDATYGLGRGFAWRGLLPREDNRSGTGSSTDDEYEENKLQSSDGDLLFTIDVITGITDSSNSKIRCVA
jgi:hypothetical protein